MIARQDQPGRWQVGLLIFSLLLYLAVILRRAWLSDDAFITFRTIDNFLHGYGLVWNIGERVQAFTHPIWLMLLTLASLVTGELVFTTLILSMLISLGVAWIIIRYIAISRLSAILAILLLLLSSAFVDYSTSGLENPLSHLLLAGFFGIFFTAKPSLPKLFWMSLLSSLCALSRQDLILIVLPGLAYAWWETRQLKGILPLILGQLPLVLWEAFSILYYGFPFPNTAYAKLNTGIPAIDLARQGLIYLRNSLRYDITTLLTVASGIILALLSRDRRTLPVAAGIVLYMLYVVKIGGDFMSGRFMAAPLLCAALIIARIDISSIKKSWLPLFFLGIVCFSLLFSYTPTLNLAEPYLTPQQRAAMFDRTGIVNERLFYNSTNELRRIDLHLGRPDHAWAQEGIQARSLGPVTIVRGTIGMFGYYAGPEVYIIDPMALADPLLARLPAKRDLKWRIGHFQRTIPDGYIESLRNNQNLLNDSDLSAFYNKLSLITRGSLFNRERLSEIWRMNTGRYASLIDFDTYAYPKMVSVTVEEVSQPKNEGTMWSAPGNIIFEDSGLEIHLGQVISPEEIQISLDGDNGYQLIYMRGDRVIARQLIEPASSDRGSLVVHCLVTPEGARKQGFDKIRVIAVSGDEEYSLGHFLPGCE